MKNIVYPVLIYLIFHSNIFFGCQANFTFSAKQSKVIFNSNSTSSGYTSYEWDYGDGSNGYGQPPLPHYYSASGKYIVTLKITQYSPFCSSTFSDTVTIGALPCQAKFAYLVNGQNVLIKNQSADTAFNTPEITYKLDGGVGKWIGNYFDTISIHYQIKGTYYVCLTYSDSICLSTYCDSVKIINAPSCQSDLNWYSSSKNEFTFYDKSKGTTAKTKYLWDFGDGKYSGEKQPYHGFPAQGNYNVCLTITDSAIGCSSKFCRNVYSLGKVPCSANFQYYSQNGANTSFYLNNISGIGGHAVYDWNYGDSKTGKQNYHQYDSVGAYKVCCNISDTNTFCFTQTCDSIKINGTYKCSPYFTSFEGFWCNFHFDNGLINTSASTKYLWDFGDSTSRQGINPNHIFPLHVATPINYKVCLTLIDTISGCTDSVCQIVTCNCFPEGIEENAILKVEISNVNLYPVPFTDELNIKFTITRNTPLTISIYNSQGQKVYDNSFGMQSSGEKNIPINLGQLAEGLYFLKMNTGQSLITKRIIKQ